MKYRALFYTCKLSTLSFSVRSQLLIWKMLVFLSTWWTIRPTSSLLLALFLVCTTSHSSILAVQLAWAFLASLRHVAATPTSTPVPCPHVNTSVCSPHLSLLFSCSSYHICFAVWPLCFFSVYQASSCLSWLPAWGQPQLLDRCFFTLPACLCVDFSLSSFMSKNIVPTAGLHSKPCLISLFSPCGRKLTFTFSWALLYCSGFNLDPHLHV